MDWYKGKKYEETSVLAIVETRTLQSRKTGTEGEYDIIYDDVYQILNDMEKRGNFSSFFPSYAKN